eukprot:89757_1
MHSHKLAVVMILVWIIRICTSDDCQGAANCADNSDCTKSDYYNCNPGDDHCYQCSGSTTGCCIINNWEYDADCDECDVTGSSYSFIIGVAILLCCCGICIGCCKVICARSTQSSQNDYQKQ